MNPLSSTYPRVILLCLATAICGCLERASTQETEIERHIRQLAWEGGYPPVVDTRYTFQNWMDENSYALMHIGFPAVPALLKALEDQTTTSCELGYGKVKWDLPWPDGGNWKTPIRVSDKANWILKQITGRDFEFDSDLPDEERREAIKKWRQWWESQGSHRSFERNSGVSR